MRRAGLLVFAVFFLLSACVVQAKDSGVRFSDLSGDVQVRPDEDRLAWDFAELDMLLQVMDHIQTKQESSAILSLADMTTFVMKPNSEIILNTESEKENKIKLLAGKVWVNVKKMVKDGSMDVEMSEAVAGIKGTNITCSSSEDRTENRVKVLRGVARVTILETREQITVETGEELVIKKGAKPEKQQINIEEEQKDWEKQTSQLGQSIQLNEVPDVIRKISEMEAQEIARLKADFEKLLSLDSVDAIDALTLQKDAERFIGVVLEDNIILGSMKKKVDQALGTPGISQNQRAEMAGLLREISNVTNSILSYREEAEKIMRYQFRIGALPDDVAAEIEMAVNEVNNIVTESDAIQTGMETIDASVESVQMELEEIRAAVDAIQAEVNNNPSGRSQDWFKESQEYLQNILENPEELFEKAQAIIEMLKERSDNVQALNEKNLTLSEQSQDISELYPTDASAIGLNKLVAQTQATLQSLTKQIAQAQTSSQDVLKQTGELQSLIALLIKALQVPYVDPAVIVEMQQIDDVMSDQMVLLQNEITSYNSIDSATTDIAERRLQSSLKIMDNYARVRRNYLSAQRLYDSIMRSAQTTSFKTSEMEDVESIWQNVSDRFQQLGIVADELQSNIESLESQLRQWLD
jgi:hypothetical protein